ncbi:beta-galactosidase/beta-glucuronidase [Belliella baltica DSM 15883]|uniref:Beta-galactosidase/beta-glucuronidase n=1 Tax=Belliella baltica (strain DSM 15883 / CIP 108006 / LMG 21964 / BA134) TaxID=866536 RepID=I3Z980_BELBD|nr:sugar-binding domain-containing protein [Belliella baltica]AFL85798.1 beta-galactosidase/beta-glucuronidase [Belliella baltica DSM 15883]
MKSTFKLLFGLLLSFLIFVEAWSQEDFPTPVITSPWASQVDKSAPHPEYPRPHMKRDSWVNLNGQWDYAILSRGNSVPEAFQGKITVPFPVESALSGVGKKVGRNNELWYSRAFDLKSNQRKGKVFLHFGAVDWEAEVFVNGKSVGVHQGGYDPFYFDISSALNRGNSQEIKVRVWDPSDDGSQPRGKQVNNPKGIWYTPVTGIWQTVWLETVPESHIIKVKNSSDFANGSIKVNAEVSGDGKADGIRVIAFAKGEKVAERSGTLGSEVELSIPDPKHWSSGSPFLYELEISLLSGNRVLDKVESYAAIREISMGYDSEGISRMLLNGEFLFQYGPLDQGWWPDGLYTAPNEEALVFDIIKTQEMGFNMIRKHVKVEPARWYYHCDRLGLLVWQDMPNGDHGNQWEQRPGIIGKGTDRERTAESESIYKKEWKAIIDANYNFPSIVVWVPFNEAWGQFKTKEITEWTKAYDPSRLVNSASGGNFEMDGSRITGDILDLHNYPAAVMPDPGLYGRDNIIVLGEFGGLGLPIEGHTWQEKDNWGYQSFKDKEALAKRYEELVVSMDALIKAGLSAAVYTQTTDVEVETNGLMTYDRRIVKFNEDWLKNLHQKLYDIKINLKKR